MKQSACMQEKIDLREENSPRYWLLEMTGWEQNIEEKKHFKDCQNILDDSTKKKDVGPNTSSSRALMTHQWLKME